MGLPLNHPSILQAAAKGLIPAADLVKVRAGSEADFQASVCRLAELMGWRWFHVHDSRRSPEGFPDLVCCRERVVYMELKTETGKLSVAQCEWIADLKNARAECYVFRPSQWDEIVKVFAAAVKLETGGV